VNEDIKLIVATVSSGPVQVVFVKFK